MISEQGIVQKINGNKAVVKVTKTSACNHCASKDSCNVTEKNAVIVLENRLNAKEGDQVEISVPEGVFLKLTLMVYMLPVIALMIGAFLGNFLSVQMNTDQSATAAITGLIFLVGSFIGLKMYEKIKKPGDKYHPLMTRIILSDRFLQSDDNK